MAFVNLKSTIARHDLTKALTARMVEILLAFSSVEEKGRLIDGVAFGHIIHEVIPDEINKVLKEFHEEEN